jgi:hypothetical protein
MMILAEGQIFFECQTNLPIKDSGEIYIFYLRKTSDGRLLQVGLDRTYVLFSK